MRLHKNPAMHNSTLPHAVQLSDPSSGGILLRNCSIPCGVHVLVTDCGIADIAVAAGDGTAEPTRSSRGLESSADFERFVTNLVV